MAEPKSNIEKRALQVLVTVASVVPISAGAGGMLRGTAIFNATGPADLEAHFRYLSGLLFAIGLAYLSAVPGIERHRTRFLLLGSLVFIGGLGRLFGVLSAGSASPGVVAALVMELGVTPLITLWQYRVSQRVKRFA